jgi:uncharacterized protein (TIGR02145 family)
MKQKITLMPISIIILIVAFWACKEDELPTLDIIDITTLEISNINSESATSGGYITKGVGITARGVCWSTIPNPTIKDSFSFDGTGTGIFTSGITDLNEWDVYYVRAYASNGAGTKYGNELTFMASNPVIDIDGNVYKTVKIGDQIWMGENLKTTHYADGSEIILENKFYCYYDNNEEYKLEYGALYNWYALMNGEGTSNQIPSGVKGVCPDGWHVPSLAEWNLLVNYLGGSAISGGLLKEEGSEHWLSPNLGATNSTLFTALPGGMGNHDGNFTRIYMWGYWWTTYETLPSGGNTIGQSTSVTLYYDNPYFGYFGINHWDYSSVRCIKD